MVSYVYMYVDSSEMQIAAIESWRKSHFLLEGFVYDRWLIGVLKHQQQPPQSSNRSSRSSSLNQVAALYTVDSADITSQPITNPVSRCLIRASALTRSAPETICGHWQQDLRKS